MIGLKIALSHDIAIVYVLRDMSLPFISNVGFIFVFLTDCRRGPGADWHGAGIEVEENPDAPPVTYIEKRHDIAMKITENEA